MKTHSFQLTLDPQGKTFDELSELVHTVCDHDGSLATTGGAPFVMFDRESETLEEAIVSAVRDLRSVGLSITHAEVDLEQLMAVA